VLLIRRNSKVASEEVDRLVQDQVYQPKTAKDMPIQHKFIRYPVGLDFPELIKKGYVVISPKRKPSVGKRS